MAIRAHGVMRSTPASAIHASMAAVRESRVATAVSAALVTTDGNVRYGVTAVTVSAPAVATGVTAAITAAFTYICITEAVAMDSYTFIIMFMALVMSALISHMEAIATVSAGLHAECLDTGALLYLSKYIAYA